MSFRLLLAGGALLGAALSSQWDALRSLGETAEPRYTLSCESSDTREKSALFCLRLDSATGQVQRIDLLKIASTAAGPGRHERDGTYQLSCDSTDTDTQATLHCVRLHRFTGEAVLLRLPDVELIPK